ncbi:hypothetical protein FG386_001037 [Cryptosporidium ryanae]|uniref:uncharacterized protein n=1 Tax=Cryptosporidium ryanae TaxID=515981 RepID=UPI00351A976F|nr:hypothetical protein FG386_001037 [Cryptosporidium ryanae]
MGKKIVSNIKNFIISGGRSQNGIKSIIKGSYPNGYRNFGPDLDRMMMPLNKKYVDISKIMEQVNELTSNNNNGGVSNSAALNNKVQMENYFTSLIKCLINYVQWDIKKERENYAKYGVLLLIKLIDNCFDKLKEYVNIINYMKNYIEIWISKEGTQLKYYGKWILLCLMKNNLQGNIGTLTRSTINERNSTLNSIPLKNCILNLKLVELICKNLINLNKNIIINKNTSYNNGLNADKSNNNKDIIDIIVILEIISLGLLTQGVIFEGKSRKVIYDSIIPSLTTILNDNIVVKYGISLHNVRYYLINETPGQSVTSTINKFIKEDNNIFFQGDRMNSQELINYLYINYLFIIETLSMILTKEDNSNNNNIGDIFINMNINNNNDNCILNKIKNQNKINILPSHFKLIDDKLNSLYYYPYILTSDICLSICRGNSDYTIEIINTISQALRYYIINCNVNKEDNNTLFIRNEPFFIKDEIMISLSGTNEDTPKTILYYKTPQYCYSLLRCLHRILCCCPKIQGISKWLTTLVNLIDILLPLYDLNGILCSRSKINDNLQINNMYVNTNTSINEMGKCALLLRNVSFQVLFDIMCLLSETAQVFYVIRVLVKIRDWCGSCLLDLIRRCQRLASEANSNSNINCLDKCNSYIRNHKKNEKNELKNISAADNNNSNCKNKFDNIDLILNSNIEIEIVSPTFWSTSKINEIANINKKWITGQMGNINNNSINSGSNINIVASCGTSSNIQNDTGFNNKSPSFDTDYDISTNDNNNSNNNNNNNGIFIGDVSIEVGLKNQNSSQLPSSSQSSFSGFSGVFSRLYSIKNKNKVKEKDRTSVTDNNIDNNNVNVKRNELLLSPPEVIVNLLNDNYLNDADSQNVHKYNNNNNEFEDEDEDDDYCDDILDDSEDDMGKEYNYKVSDDEEGDDYWEVDHKLLELIKLRPTSSLINAQPPITGILRRTVSSDISNNKSSLSKIGGSISSLLTKHNSAPPRTLSSMKRVCFSEVPQIY